MEPFLREFRFVGVASTRNLRHGTTTLRLLLVLAAAGAALAAPALEGDARPAVTTNSIYELILRKPDSAAANLHVALRREGGRFAAGVTVGPLGPTDVDGSGLTLEGDAITGILKARIGFDGYFPKDGKPLVYVCSLHARVVDQTVVGTYGGTVAPGGAVTGKVEGTVSGPVNLRGYWVMDLQMENGRGTGTLGPKSFGERVYPKLFLKDGRFAQNLIYGWGGRVQINYFESVIVTNGLDFDGKTLTGALTVRPTGGPLYVYSFEGVAVGTQIGGVYRKRVDGIEAAGGPFHGKLQPIPERPPDQSLHYLELHQAVLRTWTPDPAGSNALQLMAFVPCVDGAFGAAMAYAAAWNHTYHDVDAGGLRLEGTALAGDLKVTMNADPYMPPDRKPVPARYTISAGIVDGRLVRGTFKGIFNGIPVSGPVFGELLDRPPVPDPVSVHLKLDDGVNGGAPWHRRTWLNFVATQGRASTGTMSNNKGGWTGTFQKAEVKFEGATFTATVDGSVDETHSAEKGAYTFKLTGRVVGSELVGTCDTYRDGKPTKAGTPFMGGFGPIRR